MMQIFTEAEIRENYARWERENPTHPLVRATRPVETANVDNLLDLDGDRYLEFAGRRYRVPPVPFRAGVELQAIGAALERLKAADNTPKNRLEYREACERLARVCWSLVRPTGWRRLLRRLLPNPFARATEGELGVLHRFFSACRTTSSVRHLNRPLRA